MRCRPVRLLMLMALITAAGVVGQECVPTSDIPPGETPGDGNGGDGSHGVGEGDPPPTVGQGTLMVMVVAEANKATGIRYVVSRPDAIGKPTIRRTAALQKPGVTGDILQAHMYVQVLDQGGNVLSGLFIEDPFSPFVEVPADEKGTNLFWTKVDQKITSFLVAVPNVKGADRLAFIRFDGGGNRIDSGQVSLSDRRRKQARTFQYNTTDATHATIINNGPSDQRFDLLILAEGFQDTNADRALFNQKVQEVVNFFWSIPIYYELRAAMNVHTAYLPSVDSGADHPNDDPPLERDTPFEAFFDCNDIDRLICLGAEGRELAYEVAQDAPGNYGAGGSDAIMVLVNDTEYGGGGGDILTSSIDAQAPEIASHEFGHTVIDLADEYEDPYPSLVETARTKVNVSGSVDSRADLKWIDLVDPATPIPTAVDDDGCAQDSGCSPSTLPVGTVGMFEGAGYVPCDSFRPTTSCQMRCYVGAFCPVCRGTFYDTFDPFPRPVVDLYMRDNPLDVGNTPSPANVEDPPGSGNRVKPWHSVDIRVDAPPFGGTEHENPRAGVTNRVFITVHNRGTSAAGVNTGVELHIAGATGGAPPFPGANWFFIGGGNILVPGQEGFGIIVIDWDAPLNTPAHTCALALCGTADDPMPVPAEGLTSFVRNNNNVTWKNLHVVQDPVIEGEISNFEIQVTPIVFRIEAPDVPVDTEFNLGIDGPVVFQQFEPGALQEMVLAGEEGGTQFAFVRGGPQQQYFSLRGDLPGAENDKVPFTMPFILKIGLPGGTPTGMPFTISIDQISVDPETGLLGDLIGGNTYSVALE